MRVSESGRWTVSQWSHASSSVALFTLLVRGDSVADSAQRKHLFVRTLNLFMTSLLSGDLSCLLRLAPSSPSLSTSGEMDFRVIDCNMEATIYSAKEDGQACGGLARAQFSGATCGACKDSTFQSSS